MNVFILATCRKPELLPFTTLVFKTLRVGFLTAKVKVTINNISPEHGHQDVVECCNRVGAEIDSDVTIHHEWIERLVATNDEPFWLVDTDMIFYDSFEGDKFDAPLAGYRIPEWRDDYSRAITRARLHPSLLYVRPKEVRAAAVEFISKLPEGPFTPMANLFYPLCLPFKKQMYFYDTCAMLYQAIGGQAFTDDQKDKYCHFNFGTIPDLVLPRIPKADSIAMQMRREDILNNPANGRGAWRESEFYYHARRV